MELIIKRNYWCFLIAFVLLSFSACNKQFANENPSHSSTVIDTQWISYLTEKGFYHAVRGNYGTIIFEEHGSRNDFEYSLIEADFLRAEWAGGTAQVGSMYFDLANGDYSSKYYNVVAVKNRKIAYMLSDKMTLVVHDAFDEQQGRSEFTLDCLVEPIKESIVDVGWSFPFMEVEFLDTVHLKVTYANSENKLSERVLMMSKSSDE